MSEQGCPKCGRNDGIERPVWTADEQKAVQPKPGMKVFRCEKHGPFTVREESDGR